MITPDDIATSGGKYPERAKSFTKEHRVSAATLCDRVNALLRDLGIDIDPARINEGFRLEKAKYGAPRSWHKRGGAVDFSDQEGFPLAHQITRTLLAKHGLRREDTDYTVKTHSDGSVVRWCHLDIGEPYGSVFKP